MRGLARGTHPILSGAVASQEGPPTGSNPPAGALGEPPSEPKPPTETASSSTTFVLQQIRLNGGCNFGTAIANSRQYTHIAVEKVIYAAEGLHSQAMANMAEQAQWDHQQQMARVVQEAQEVLARQSHDTRALHETQAQSYAAEAHDYQNQVHAAASAVRAAEQVASFTSSARIQQLETALQLQGNEHLQLLARPRSPPKSSAPSSAKDDDYLGFYSDSTERPMPDKPASHRR